MHFWVVFGDSEPVWTRDAFGVSECCALVVSFVSPLRVREELIGCSYDLYGVDAVKPDYSYPGNPAGLIRVDQILGSTSSPFPLPPPSLSLPWLIPTRSTYLHESFRRLPRRLRRPPLAPRRHLHLRQPVRYALFPRVPRTRVHVDLLLLDGPSLLPSPLPPSLLLSPFPSSLPPSSLPSSFPPPPLPPQIGRASCRERVS